jgi:hypothetical protein
MTEIPSIPQDDLMDVMEMTQKIENYICKTLKGNEHKLAMSALMSSSVNCMLGQCKNLDEVIFYRNLFMQILDTSIRCIQVKGPESPSS